VGDRVKATALPELGVRVMPVMPTVAASTETLVNAGGVEVMVTARLAFCVPPPPPPPVGLFGPLQPTRAIMEIATAIPNAALRFITHPK